MARLLLIDTFNYIHRAYHALPKTFKDKNGESVNAVYGVTSMLISTLDALKPTHVIAALDDDKPTKRGESFAAYKANRKELEPELKSQLSKIEEIISAFGIPKFLLTGFEADDIIGTLAKQAEKAGIEVAVVSNDRDLLQILSPSIRVFVLDSAKQSGHFFGVSDFKSKYEFEPINMIDYKALRGDPSDNIPGVFGIGDKTALELVQKYKTIENLYENIGDIKKESLKLKLVGGYESAVLSKQLATIDCSLDIKLDLKDCKLKQIDRLAVVEVLKRYNFKSLIRRLGFEVDKENVKKLEDNKNQLALF